MDKRDKKLENKQWGETLKEVLKGGSLGSEIKSLSSIQQGHELVKIKSSLNDNTSMLAHRKVGSGVLRVTVGIRIRIVFEGFPVWLLAMDKSLCQCVHFPHFKNLN